MVCRTLEVGVGKKPEARSKEIEELERALVSRAGETLVIDSQLEKIIKGEIRMREKFSAAAYNLRNALWRVEDLRQEVEKEADKKLRHNIYEIQSSVNNLMGIVKLCNENLNELEALLRETNVKKMEC